MCDEFTHISSNIFSGIFYEYFWRILTNFWISELCLAHYFPYLDLDSFSQKSCRSQWNWKSKHTEFSSSLCELKPWYFQTSNWFFKKSASYPENDSFRRELTPSSLQGLWLGLELLMCSWFSSMLTADLSNQLSISLTGTNSLQ